ncbi:shufflon protein D' [Escherichia coli]
MELYALMDASIQAIYSLKKQQRLPRPAPPNGLVGRDSTGAILSCRYNSSGEGHQVALLLTGKIANGQQSHCHLVFLPASVADVSNAELQGWKPNYFAGSVATYDANRIVKCGFYDEYNFYGGTKPTDLSGKCSYIVVCQ